MGKKVSEKEYLTKTPPPSYSIPLLIEKKDDISERTPLIPT